jgi:hypothetical protein
MEQPIKFILSPFTVSVSATNLLNTATSFDMTVTLPLRYYNNDDDTHILHGKKSCNKY